MPLNIPIQIIEETAVISLDDVSQFVGLSLNRLFQLCQKHQLTTQVFQGHTPDTYFLWASR